MRGQSVSHILKEAMYHFVVISDFNGLEGILFQFDS